jgi:subtilase family serine protease
LTAVGAVVAMLLLAAGAQAAAPTGTTPANEHVCGVPAAGRARCFAIRHYPAQPAAGHNGGHKPKAEPIKYGAKDIQSAYGLEAAAASGGAGNTVAIVDAYDDPNAFADLNAYRAAQGLGAVAECAPGAHGTTSPCFAKVNQAGEAGEYPTSNIGWAEEISLDLDMVSATCPRCDILLVEANTNSLEDLAAGVDTAVGLGAVAVGNSYGGPEFASEAQFAQEHYAWPVAITASSGDSGYAVEFPAAASSVIAVGGTSLRRTSGGGWSQTVWSGAGSGCSAYVPKPEWQSDTGCARRTVADVAAVADPNTGVEVFDSFHEPGWMVFGGTSASAQIIAGVYGLVGGASDASGLYRHEGLNIPFGSANPGLADVTSGSNGSCAGHGRFANSSLAYLCTGAVGYDGPTGMGTPAGVEGF